VAGVVATLAAAYGADGLSYWFADFMRCTGVSKTMTTLPVTWVLMGLRFMGASPDQEAQTSILR
jgi:hypothetical protein